MPYVCVWPPKTKAMYDYVVYVGIELNITLYGRTKKKFVNSEHSSAVCQNSGQNKYVIKTLENKPLFVIMYTYL